MDSTLTKWSPRGSEEESLSYPLFPMWRVCSVRPGQGPPPRAGMMSEIQRAIRHLLHSIPRATNSVCFLKVSKARELSHTTVTFAIPHLHLDEVLHPKGVTDTAFGEGVTAPVLRAVQLTCWGPETARWTQWLTREAKKKASGSSIWSTTMRFWLKSSHCAVHSLSLAITASRKKCKRKHRGLMPKQWSPASLAT